MGLERGRIGAGAMARIQFPYAFGEFKCIVSARMEPFYTLLPLFREIPKMCNEPSALLVTNPRVA